MNENPPGPDTQTDALATDQPETAAPAPPDGEAAATSSGVGALPAWLPWAAIAIVPALVVGIVVYALASGDGGGSGGAGAVGIVEGLLRLSPDENTKVDSFNGKLPPDFPDDFPMFRGSKVVVSFAVQTNQGTNYFAILTNPRPTHDIFEFYREALDKDPWQLEIGRSSDEFTGLRFSRPDNADVSGDITIHHSELDGTTAIYLSYEDVSATLAPGSGGSTFSLGPTRPLPPGFPKDVPIYSERDSVILDTYFERQPGGQVFLVSFLTRDSQDDVMKFYTDEFANRGWTTNDSTSSSNSFALSLDFSDGNKSLQGSVTADVFENDSAYTKVDLLVQVTSARRSGN